MRDDQSSRADADELRSALARARSIALDCGLAFVEVEAAPECGTATDFDMPHVPVAGLEPQGAAATGHIATKSSARRASWIA